MAPKVTPVNDRFWNRVDKLSTSCWIWTGTVGRANYGEFWLSTTQGHTFAHRYAYQIVKGEIPKGLVLDHLCRNPLCVNPDHLEAVTQQVNTLRGVGPSAINAQKTYCPKGHEYTEENTYIHSGKRYCCICRREHQRQFILRKKNI